MKDYLARLFKNNGIARGWLYVITALALSVGDDLYEFGKWIIDNREMLIGREVSIYDGFSLLFLGSGKFILAVGAALTTLRAYLDQHLTKAKNEKAGNTTTIVSP